MNELFVILCVITFFALIPKTGWFFGGLIWIGERVERLAGKQSASERPDAPKGGKSHPNISVHKHERL